MNPKIRHLKHPNIVEIKGVILSPLSIVMEFIKYGDLCNFLHNKKKETKLTWRMKLRIIFDIAKGILM